MAFDTKEYVCTLFRSIKVHVLLIMTQSMCCPSHEWYFLLLITAIVYGDGIHIPTLNVRVALFMHVPQGYRCFKCMAVCRAAGTPHDGRTVPVETGLVFSDVFRAGRLGHGPRPHVAVSQGPTGLTKIIYNKRKYIGATQKNHPTIQTRSTACMAGVNGI